MIGPLVVRFWRYTLCVVCVLLSISYVDAAPQRTTYQARIVKPDGYPLEAGSVQFRFTILDPTGTCVIFIEDYTNVNMSGSGGLISFALGSGVRSFPASATTFASAFDNSTVSYSCQSPGIYNPVATDVRKIVMQFNDGNGWQTLPAMAINAVPYAMYATQAESSKQLNGKSDTDFIEKANIPTCAASEMLYFNGVSFSCVSYTASGGIDSLTTSGSVLVNSGTASSPVLSVTVASMSSDGYLTSLDYAEFKAKLAASATQIADTLGFAPVSGAAVATQIASSNLSGDVSGTISANSVVSVGGKTASQIATTVDDTLAATSSATASALVKRDSNAESSFNGVSIYKPSTSFSVKLQANTSLSANYVLTLPQTAGSNGQVLSTDGSGNLSWTNAATGSVTSVSATSPLSSTGGATPSISISQATSSTDGYLSASDWTTFATGVIADARLADQSGVASGTQYTKVTVDGKGRVTSGAQLDSSDVVAALGYTPANAASAGIATLNGSSSATQTFANSLTGTIPAFNTVNGVHTLNIPYASEATTTAGLISNAEYVSFSNKITSSSASIAEVLGYVPAASGSAGVGTLLSANNLSDVASSTVARNNLGLGDLATLNSIDLSSTQATGIIADARFADQSNVVSGTQYTKVTIDGKGRVVSGALIDSADVITALGFTPQNAASSTAGTVTNVSSSNSYLTVASASTTPVLTINVGTTANTIAAGDDSRFGNALRIQGVSVTAVTPTVSGQVLRYDGSQWVPNFVSMLDLRSNVTGMQSLPATCSASQTLTYNSLTDSLACSNISISSSQVVGLGALAVGDSVDLGTASATGIIADARLVDQSGIVSGTQYSKLTVDGKGRVVSGAQLASSDVTTALGYTPAESGTIIGSQWVTSGSTINYPSGNVGIGVTGTPSYKLHVAGTTNIAGSLYLTSVEVLTGGAGANTQLKTPVGYDVILSPNNTERVRVTSAGAVGIGTTTPITKLSVSGGVQISMESAACAVGYAGTLRYNAGNVEFCNGSTWAAFGVSGAGVQSLNGSTSGTQSFANSLTGTTPAFVTANGVHTLNIPYASEATTTAGLISNSDYMNFSNKLSSVDLSSTQATGIVSDARLADQSGVVSGTQYTKVTVDSKGRVTSGAQLDLSDVTTALGYTPASASASSQWTSSGSAIFYNSGNVGIGTSAPVRRLDLYSNSGSSTGINLIDGGVGGRSYAIVATNDGSSVGGGKLSFYDNVVGASRFVVNSSGNVGIGTTSPITKLEVSGGVRISMESATCAVSYAGTLRYNSGNVEFCNGSTWAAFGVSGAGVQSLNGSTSGTQSFANSLTGTTPAFVTNNGVHTLNIPYASEATTTAGLISNSDYMNFSNKLSSVDLSSTQATGIVSDARLADQSGVVSGTQYTKVTVDSKGRVTSGAQLDLSDVTTALGYTPVESGTIIGSQWTTSGSAISYTNGNVGVGTAGLSVASSARYWRIKSATPGSNGSYISISELRFVWGGTPQSLTGYSVTNLGGTFDYALANIKDGVVETTNANNIAATTSSLDIYFDLGTAQTVTEIQIAPQGTQDSIVYNTPTNLIVESSNDASVWVQVGSHASISIDYPNWNAGSYRSFAVPGPAATLLSRLTVEGVNSTAANAALQVINSSQDSILYARNDGRVGIGTQSPATTLDVSGGVRISMESAACAAGLAGTLRYNAGSVEFCDGSSWAAFGGGSGMSSFNGSTSGTQTLAFGTGGTSPAFSTTNGVHTLNIPYASEGTTTAGLISNTDYLTFNNKVSSQWTTSGSTIYYNTGNVGIGTTTPSYKLELSGTAVTDRKIGMNGTQVLYLPEQSTAKFIGSYFAGNGGGSLSHSAGNEGYYNTGVGISAMFSVTSGYHNTAQGYYSLFGTTTGDFNTAFGAEALRNNMTGDQNTAVGYRALYSSGATGGYNTAVGTNTLSSNSNGNRNIALGSFALNQNSSGNDNFGAGYYTMFQNTTGNYNAALGSYSLQSNTIGFGNVTHGYYTMNTNVAKSENTAIGHYSMRYADSTSVSSTSYNTAVGAYSLQGSTTAANNTGTSNTALGHSALRGMTSGSGNIGIGYNAGASVTTGSNNIIIGSNTGSTIATSSNNILIADGAGNERIRINSSGYVGIGTTNPGTALHVLGATAFENSTNSSVGPTFSFWKTRSYAATQNNDELGFISFYGHDGSALGRSAYFAGFQDGTVSTGSLPGRLSFFTTASGSTESTERMRIDSSGNVGIGTTTPVYPLSVYRGTAGVTVNAESGDAGNVAQNRYAGLTSGTVAQVYGAGLNISNGNGGYEIYDYTDGASRFYIDSNGNVGVGTLSPAAKLEVAGEVKFGNTSSTCNASNEGQQRYNSTTKNMEFCDGTAWTAYGTSGRTSCPAGFSLVGTSGTPEAYCISTNEETSATWLNAVTSCSNKSPAARLCTASEWAHACVKAATYGISNMTGNLEWVADLTGGNAQLMGNSACDSFSNNTVGSSYVSRCCFR